MNTFDNWLLNKEIKTNNYNQKLYNFLCEFLESENKIHNSKEDFNLFPKNLLEVENQEKNLEEDYENILYINKQSNLKKEIEKNLIDNKSSSKEKESNDFHEVQNTLEKEKLKLFNCDQVHIFNITYDPISNFETRPSSNSNINLNNSKPRKYFRVDDAKKHFKVAISQFATQKLNSLIKKSILPNKYKKKIHLPHYKLFTSNPKELDNYKFLSFNLKNVFTYGKNNSNLQKSNEENISKILKYYDKYPQKTQEIKEFLDLKYIDLIKLFYGSELFQEFRETELTKFFNDGIKEQKNICLLEDYGLIKLFQMTKKKRKRTFVLY